MVSCDSTFSYKYLTGSDKLVHADKQHYLKLVHIEKATGTTAQKFGPSVASAAVTSCCLNAL